VTISFDYFLERILQEVTTRIHLFSVGLSVKM